MLGSRRSQAEEGWVQVEGGDQGEQTGVGDHAEARQRLNLLPAVELLPQGRRHLGQGLPARGRGEEEAAVCYWLKWQDGTTFYNSLGQF